MQHRSRIAEASWATRSRRWRSASGWPYDIHSFVEVAPLLAAAGYRVIGAPHPDPSRYAAKFSGKHAHRTIGGGVGHDLPREAPRAFADAVIEVARY
jgi:hypothetical protein